MIADVDDAWRDATGRFAAVLGGITSALDWLRQPPAIRLGRVRSPHVTARIRRSRTGRVSIEFGNNLLHRLLNLIAQLDDAQVAALLDPAAPSAPPGEGLETVRLALYSIAEQFVTHHELFHLLCGHLDHRIASSKARRLSLEEYELAAAARANGAPTQEDEASHLPLFIELEADNSALQFLADKCVIGDLAAVCPSLEAAPTPLSRVDGADKAPAFRVCLTAVWLVLWLFEDLRDGEPSRSHPWPATRLLAVLFTLLPYYADIPDRTLEERSGERFTTLTEQTAALATEYLVEVVRPAMKFALALADDEQVVRQYRSPDPALSGLFSDVLLDLKALIFDAEVQTPGGLQLLAVGRRRAAFGDLFKPYRYFDPDTTA